MGWLLSDWVSYCVTAPAVCSEDFVLTERLSGSDVFLDGIRPFGSREAVELTLLL